MEMPACSTPGKVEIHLPASKSEVLRMVVMGYLTDGRLLGLTPSQSCRDVESLLGALERLSLSGPEVADITIEEGGAPLRFLVAMVASMAGKRSLIHVGPRLAERPVLPLINGLRSVGGVVERSDFTGSIMVDGHRLKGGEVLVDLTRSSQFASALMMASTIWEEGLVIRRDTLNEVSRPYIEMTAKIISRFGPRVESGDEEIRVIPDPLHFPEEWCPESDWSAASFFLMFREVARVRGYAIPEFTLPGLKSRGDGSLQGDSIFPELLERGLADGGTPELDLTDYPDLAIPLAVGLALCGRAFRLKGLKTLLHKESDRVSALMEELGRGGYRLHRDDRDGDISLSWDGESSAELPPPGSRLRFSAHGDHRMAMALCGFIFAGYKVDIDDPEVVAKSFPTFWEELKKIQ